MDGNGLFPQVVKGTVYLNFESQEAAEKSLAWWDVIRMTVEQETEVSDASACLCGGRETIRRDKTTLVRFSGLPSVGWPFLAWPPHCPHPRILCTAGKEHLSHSLARSFSILSPSPAWIQPVSRLNLSCFPTLSLTRSPSLAFPLPGSSLCPPFTRSFSLFSCLDPVSRSPYPLSFPPVPHSLSNFLDDLHSSSLLHLHLLLFMVASPENEAKRH